MTQEPEERSITVSIQFERFNVPGTTLTGTYKGCQMIPFRTDSGVLPQYSILTPKGFVVFNGTYQLNRAFQGLPVGIKVEVTYKGEQKTTKFKVKDFDVKVLGDDVDKVLEYFQGLAPPTPNNTSFLPPGVTVDPLTGEIIPNNEEEDGLPF